jgi:hypothetical protein
MSATETKYSDERGSAFVEFLLCTSLFLVPLLLGAMVIGLNVVRAVQVTTLCRASAHMYSENVDFSQAQNQQELIKIAQGLNITTTSGNGVIILSKVTYITLTQCQAGGYPNGCANENQYVITNRIVIGNSTVHSSVLGTPPSQDMDPSGNGNVLSSGYLNDPATVAQGFSSIISLPVGQYAYVAETYYDSPDLNWWNRGIPQIGARFVF